jgi:sialic acid synthase SpsE/mannose-6-phosphate isomerase-like protein (cupin superfamily)
MSNQIPEKLFVLELANNHMGDVGHGLRIIKECAKVTAKFPQFNFAFKMQYRDLDTFIHPNFKERQDIKYIKRFSETRLSREQMAKLVFGIKDAGFTAICTPFDENSVEYVKEDQFDILKIASVSFTDWPLLERATAAGKPMILSTAGASLEDIDSVVAFLENRKIDFVLMHCVAEYPTKIDNMQLNQIDLLRQRYRSIRLGFSTHEPPGETMTVAMAIAKGATVFEKHVGTPTPEYPLNDYSATPEQLELWLESAQRAYSINGGGDQGATLQRTKPTEKEFASLFALRRGVFAKRDIEAGEIIRTDDVFMAIPTEEGHITANDWSKYTRFFATVRITSGASLLQSNTRRESTRDKIIAAVLQINEILKKGNIVIPNGTKMEISHHHGIDEFNQVGAALLTIINRDYCKKIIVMLPGQKHPAHYHKKKDETLHVLHGTLRVNLSGVEKDYTVGEMIIVEPGSLHSFSSTNGAVFEEISSTHLLNDSVYEEEAINCYTDRKTMVNFWNELSTGDIDRAQKSLLDEMKKASGDLELAGKAANA